jgi:DNA-binding transcriptional LysR family regulator
MSWSRPRAVVRPLPDSLIRRRIGLGKMVLWASPEYLSRHGTPTLPADLAHHNCLTYVNSSVKPVGEPDAGNRHVRFVLDHHWRFTDGEREHGVDVSGSLRSNSIEALRAAALAGQGISLLPAGSVADDVTSGRLVRLLPGVETSEAVVHALYPASRHLSVNVRTFIDFLAKRWREGLKFGTAQLVPPQSVVGADSGRGGAAPSASANRREFTGRQPGHSGHDARLLRLAQHRADHRDVPALPGPSR